NGDLSILKFKDIEKLQNKISLAHINLAEELVYKSRIPPFTKIILDKHLQGLVLYSGQKPPYFGKIVLQNLKTRTCHENLAKLLGISRKVIKPLIDRYQYHSNDLQDSFYAYFIRPFAEHRVYNGILLLLLKRSLDESEYMEIGNLWTKILSETALLKIAKLE